MPLNGIHSGGALSIGGALSAPELVSFSANGSAAALVSSGGGTLQILTNLEDTPRITTQADVSGLDATAVTVSNDGALAVVLTRTGEVYLVPSSGSPRLIFRTGSPAGLSFLPDQSLAIADGAAGTITVIDGLTSQPFTRATISGPYLSGEVALLQASSDGKFLLLAASKAQTAYRIDLADQSVRSLDVPASVSRLERLSGDVFLFSANPGEAAWLLIADTDGLRAGFAQFAGAPFVNKTPPRRVGPPR
jgi:WD40 repeat protein